MPLPRFRPRRTTRPEAWRGLALPVLLVLLAACGTGRPPAPAPGEAPRGPEAQPFAVQEQPFLVDPLTGFPGQVDPGRQERLREAHRALLAASDVQGAAETADELLQEDPAFAPAHVLIAQLDLGEGDYDKAIARLLPVSDEAPQYVASQLVLGRAAELAGDVPLAYSAYREIAPRNPRAFQKVGELHPRALEVVSNRLQEALRLERLDDADKHLALLRAWAPSEGRTLEGARALAAARGDQAAELAAVKELVGQRPGERALIERRAELELAVGDPSAGLQIIQDLAAENPRDPELAEKLAAAKFRWRMSLLPKAVQDVAAKPELTKADLAVLLYWLVPNVRYARPTQGRIATDILEHQHQEEIVRVVNLGLMEVDPTLHRFSPGAPARRSTALRSLTLVLSRFGQKLACLGGKSGACEVAASCGLVPPEEECRATAALTGSEAVELIRRTLKHLGGA